MPSTTTSGTPLEETEWYRNGGHQEWLDRNRRWGYAYRFIKQYEGTDKRMIALRKKCSKDPKAEKPEDRAAQLLTPVELEEIYEFSRDFDELPEEEPESTEKKPRGYAKVSWAAEAKRLRESGLVPISDAHRADLRRKLGLLKPGVACEFVYLTEKSHITRKGDFVSFDETHIILMGENGSFWKIPIERVFHGTYDINQQGGKIK